MTYTEQQIEAIQAIGFQVHEHEPLWGQVKWYLECHNFNGHHGEVHLQPDTVWSGALRRIALRPGDFVEEMMVALGSRVIILRNKNGTPGLEVEAIKANGGQPVCGHGPTVPEAVLCLWVKVCLGYEDATLEKIKGGVLWQ